MYSILSLSRCTLGEISHWPQTRARRLRARASGFDMNDEPVLCAAFRPHERASEGCSTLAALVRDSVKERPRRRALPPSVHPESGEW